ncbi:MAG TPA: Ldh family oxidoreductase [Bordetella sp.]
MSQTDSKTIWVGGDSLRRFIAAALRRVGLPAADAETVAGLMADADLQGSDGHGAIRLPQYVQRIESGGINVRPDIRVVHERPAMAVVDGDNGMGHLVVSRAVKLAIEKARAAGVAWVGTRASNHAGPASLYARMPLEHDMIGLYFAVGNANHLPPWGGLEMLLSTNPIAAAVPAGEEPAVVLDMATTVAAYGKVKARAKRGEPMPEGWMIDRNGQPLTDPTRSHEGFLMPIGGYKGYGLALIVGLLAGTLQGAAMGRDVVDFNADHTTPTNTGQAILVIDLAAFGGAAPFKSAVDTLVRDIRGSERMPGVDRIWLPGEQSHERRAAYARSGAPLTAALVEDLDRLASRLGIDPLARGAAPHPSESSTREGQP